MILASKSEQRKKLIKLLFEKYEIISVETDEIFDENLDIYENLKNISYEKAIAVFRNSSIQNDVIIGVDTVVYFDDKILLKPKSYDEAFAMIRSYEGREQEVISGLTMLVIKNGKIKTTIKVAVISKVKFNNLSDENIKKWLSLDLYKNCSGGFMIEKVEDNFEMVISGSYSNIIGLPLEVIKDIASELNIATLDTNITNIELLKKSMA